jgi:DNA-binding NarL/FixJ family response regulator
VIVTHSDSEAQICRALDLGAKGYLLLGCSANELMDGLRSAQRGVTALSPSVALRVADRHKRKALTTREEEVLRRIMRGFCNKKIASELEVAVGTIKSHLKAILSKLQAKNRTEALVIARRQGILPDEFEQPYT